MDPGFVSWALLAGSRRRVAARSSAPMGLSLTCPWMWGWEGWPAAREGLEQEVHVC